MKFNIDRSGSDEGIYTFTSESETTYIVKIRETAPRSGLWSIDFVKLSGTPSTNEIFRTMKVLSDLCKEYVDSVGGSKVIMLISGNKEESYQKAKVFSRWMGENWNCEIAEPQIKIPGLRQPYISSTPYLIWATKNEKPIELKSNISIEEMPDIKFCFNCGTPNNSYQFCPSCGTKLKQ
jgi:hypothetical protein